jgi:hypothetical protein
MNTHGDAALLLTDEPVVVSGHLDLRIVSILRPPHAAQSLRHHFHDARMAASGPRNQSKTKPALAVT